MLRLTRNMINRLDKAQRTVEDWATKSYDPETDLTPATKFDLWTIGQALDEVISVLLLASIEIGEEHRDAI